MDRCPRRRGLLLALLIVGLVPLAGCSAIATAMYVVKGTNVPAEYDGLRNKRVAVVCRPSANLTYGNTQAAKLIAKEVNSLLRQNVRKIKLVDQREVEEWIDSHGLDEYDELGRALDVDMILAIELEHFSLYQGQTIYQGKITTTFTVYDMRQDGEVVYERAGRESMWPPNAVVSTSEKSEIEFRRDCVREFSREIARHFYAHDSHVDIARDSRAF